MWILGSFRKEFLYLYFPGLLSSAVAIFYPGLGESSLLYGILAMGIIDSGHVYTTAWRTWLHPEEVRSSSAYWFFPLLFFSLFFGWFYFSAPYLWAFVVYATFYHHIRQVYGFTKWYQKLNRRSDRVSDYYLYFFALAPMLIYHFRPEATAGYYTEKDLFLFPMPLLRDVLLFVYFFVAASWALREWKLWKSGIQETNRLFSVAVPAVIYAFCFLVGTTITQVLFPLLFLHGIAYFGVMASALEKTQKRFQREGIAIFVIIMTALIFGLTESWFEENIISHSHNGEPILSSVIIGLSLTPLFCHYAFDAIIWKRNHRESKLLF